MTLNGQARNQRPLRVALGYFDSLHRGHAAVIRRAVERSDDDGCEAAVITFDMSVLRPGGKTPEDVMSLEHRSEQIGAMGVHRVIALDFRSVAGLSGQEFVENILVGVYQARGVCCGVDFRFGADRSSGSDQLAQLCGRYGLTLDLVQPVLYEGQPISSTRIKQAVARGDMRAAGEMLGRSYSQKLTVYQDRQLATKLGFPTINQLFPECLVCPRYGVYRTRVIIDGRQYDAVSNIGHRPTVTSQAGGIVLESHILDYKGNLYGRDLEVSFVEFMRDEQRFDDITSLKAAVERDIEQVRRQSCGAAQCGPV